MTDDGCRTSRRVADPASTKARQLDRLNRLLEFAVREHRFYRDKYANVRLPLQSLDELSRLPLLEKRELSPPPEAAAKSGTANTGGGDPAVICGLPRERYVRFHRTSGTTGRPLQVLDTDDDWNWWLGCWQYVLDAAEVSRDDVAFMAFSYGPFIGFWTAHDSCARRGATVVPGGGMTSVARIALMQECGATVLFCTPTYAMHLAVVAAEQGIDLRGTSISRIVVAGEPGGSIPEVRERIEQHWNARVIDHCGATELGAWGVGSRDGKGIHVIESEFIAECLVFEEPSPQGRPADPGELSELVMTGLGRFGAPAIRYRTGDLVRPRPSEDAVNRFLYLDGGVVGRADSMVVVRGVNIFPASIEALVRRAAGDAEYRVIQSCCREMAQLRVEVEAAGSDGAVSLRLGELFRDQLGLRIDVAAVPVGTLPRFEAKARRWVREDAS